MLHCFKLFFRVQYEKYHFQDYSSDQALLIELLDKVGIMDHNLATTFAQKSPVRQDFLFRKCFDHFIHNSHPTKLQMSVDKRQLVMFVNEYESESFRNFATQILSQTPVPNGLAQPLTYHEITILHNSLFSDDFARLAFAYFSKRVRDDPGLIQIIVFEHEFAIEPVQLPSVKNGKFNYKQFKNKLKQKTFPREQLEALAAVYQFCQRTVSGTVLTMQLSQLENIVKLAQPFSELWHSAKALYNFPSAKNFEKFVLELIRCVYSDEPLAFGAHNKETKEIDALTPISFFQAVKGGQKICLRPVAEYRPLFEFSAVNNVYLATPPEDSLVTENPLIGLL